MLYVYYKLIIIQDGNIMGCNITTKDKRQQNAQQSQENATKRTTTNGNINTMQAYRTSILTHVWNFDEIIS